MVPTMVIKPMGMPLISPSTLATRRAFHTSSLSTWSWWLTTLSPQIQGMQTDRLRDGADSPANLLQVQVTQITPVVVDRARGGPVDPQCEWNSVLLPAPDSPAIAMNSPGRARIVTSSRIRGPSGS